MLIEKLTRECRWCRGLIGYLDEFSKSIPVPVLSNDYREKGVHEGRHKELSLRE